MSEEEKKAIETVEGFIKYYKNNEQTGNRANLDVLREECQAIEFVLNKYDVTQKELNSLKEIEQLHQEENGLLRQELDMQIEHNKELEATLKQTQDSWFEDTQKIEQLKLNVKDLQEKLKIATAMLTKGTYPEQNEGDNDFDKYYISKDKIKEKIEEVQARMGNDCVALHDFQREAKIDVLKELLEEK